MDIEYIYNIQIVMNGLVYTTYKYRVYIQHTNCYEWFSLI